MDTGGWIMPYEKDLIAERDSKEKLYKSVIKWWNVNYVDMAMLAQQEEEEQLRLAEEQKRKEEEDEALKLALEISARLEAEAAADEALKQAEIAEAMAMAQGGSEMPDDDFNATTGTYSGRYGKNITLDESGLNQVNDILNEKSNNINDLFAMYKE